MSERLAVSDTVQIRLLITGAPRTKKTSNQLVQVGKAGEKRVIVMPSRAWKQWVAQAYITNNVSDPNYVWPLTGRQLPEREYNCRAHFYRDANRGDAVGYYQGLADLLEKRGVLVDDKCIVSWDGSRLFVDRENPRTEVILEAL